MLEVARNKWREKLTGKRRIETRSAEKENDKRDVRERAELMHRKE